MHLVGALSEIVKIIAEDQAEEILIPAKTAKAEIAVKNLPRNSSCRRQSRSVVTTILKTKPRLANPHPLLKLRPSHKLLMLITKMVMEPQMTVAPEVMKFKRRYWMRRLKIRRRMIMGLPLEMKTLLELSMFPKMTEVMLHMHKIMLSEKLDCLKKNNCRLIEPVIIIYHLI